MTVRCPRCAVAWSGESCLGPQRLAQLPLATLAHPCLGSSTLSRRAHLLPAATEAAVERAVAAGATNAGSAVAAAKDVDFLVTMLPTTQSVIDTFDAVLGECKDGSLIIDCSTIDPIATQKLSAKAAGMGRRVIDAPVSGGVGGAEAGTLTFMVGGSDTDFEASKTVLQSMGANIVHCGGAGTGQVAKICNNLILGISMSGVSEAMNLG